MGGEGRGARGEGAMQRVGRGTGLSHREIGEEMALPCLALIRRPPRTSALDLGGSGLCPCPVSDAGLTPRTLSPPPRQPGAPVVTPPGDLPPDIALSLRPPSPSPPSSSPSRRHRRAAPAASVAVVTFAVVACVSSLSVQRGVTLCASFPPPLRLRRVLPCELATPWYVHAFCLEVSVLSWCRGVVVSWCQCRRGIVVPWCQCRRGVVERRRSSWGRRRCSWRRRGSSAGDKVPIEVGDNEVMTVRASSPNLPLRTVLPC